MNQLTLRDQTVLFDRQATLEAYKTIDAGGADRCACGDCKNFANFREQTYGIELRQLLERLGIDRRKEWEVYTFDDAVNGLITYGGWVVFVGEWAPQRVKREHLITKGQPFHFTESFPNASLRFEQKALAIEFLVAVPKAIDHVSNWA